MALKYVRFLVLIGLLSAVILQDQFGLFPCESAKRVVDAETQFNGFSSSGSVNLSLGPGSGSGSGSVSVSGSARSVSGSEDVNSSDEDQHQSQYTDSGSDVTDTDLDYTDDEYGPPSESSSDGRLTGMSRGRSRERHFKRRIGERRPESDEDSTTDSSDDDGYTDTSDSRGRAGHSKESYSSGSEKRLFSSSDEDRSESSSESVRTSSSKESGSETEPEEMEPPMPIVPPEYGMMPRGSVDQAIQLLHDQSNLEAMKELEKKKKLKKEKLENQEKMMDKLVSVIDSMQRKLPLVKEHLYGSLKNYNIGDLENADYFYQREFEDAARTSSGDSQKVSKEFKQMEILNELKTASMAKLFYSRPNTAVLSEIQAYTPLIGGSVAQDTALGSSSGKDQVVRPKTPIVRANPPGKTTRSLGTQTSISSDTSTADLDAGSPTRPETKPKLAHFAGETSAADHNEALGSTSASSSASGSTSGSPSGSASPSASTSRKDSGESVSQGEQRGADGVEGATGPEHVPVQSTETDEFGASEAEGRKGPVPATPMDQLKLELIKFQDKVDLDLKKSTPTNNVGRIRPKDSYSQDDYLVRTSRREETFLTRGKVSIGRIRRPRGASSGSPEGKSVSKPIAVVGRLKSPSRKTQIDQMRPVREEDESVYDFSTANRVFSIKSRVAAIRNQEIEQRITGAHLRGPMGLSGPVPHGASAQSARTTHFLGDSPPRADPNLFRRGMMASASRGAAPVQPLPGVVQYPIVRVQKVKGANQKEH
ncbi:putative signal peptide-containing protein [Cryptosporidium canis]|uniref:Signal peptide-containing protein n=1 Tax=Cryptosporidium canis TaxID=195482 RepID=A0ABQ8PA96_9CRYT|nr:putative signal peptide-containing protein [Cryptosporidium canis]